jgi:hypothetical protein
MSETQASFLLVSKVIHFADTSLTPKLGQQLILIMLFAFLEQWTGGKTTGDHLGQHSNRLQTLHTTMWDSRACSPAGGDDGGSPSARRSAREAHWSHSCSCSCGNPSIYGGGAVLCRRSWYSLASLCPGILPTVTSQAFHVSLDFWEHIVVQTWEFPGVFAIHDVMRMESIHALCGKTLDVDSYFVWWIVGSLELEWFWGHYGSVSAVAWLWVYLQPCVFGWTGESIGTKMKKETKEGLAFKKNENFRQWYSEVR